MHWKGESLHEHPLVILAGMLHRGRCAIKLLEDTLVCDSSEREFVFSNMPTGI